MLIGHRGHDEVVGTMGEAPEAIVLVGSPEDVDRLEVDNPEKMVYLTQTTLSIDDAERIIARLRQRFPRIVGPSQNDICYATQNRQKAVLELAREADFALVVGSQTSSNSRRLAELCRASGVETRLIDGPADIDSGWFSGRETVLVTAGASAPEDVVQDCVRLLQDRFGATVESRAIRDEEVRFPLPRGIDMKINELEFFLVQLQCEVEPAPVAVAVGAAGHGRGRGGLGRSAAGVAAGLARGHGARRCCRCLAGRSVFDIEEMLALEALREAPLRSAVEMACWDMIGRDAAGSRCAICSAAATGGESRWRFACRPARPRASPNSPGNWPNKAFTRRFSFRPGQPGVDAQTVVAVRESVGDRVELRLDGSAGLRPPDRAGPVRGTGVQPLAVLPRSARRDHVARGGGVGKADERAAGGVPGDPRAGRRAGSGPLRGRSIRRARSGAGRRTDRGPQVRGGGRGGRRSGVARLRAVAGTGGGRHAAPGRRHARPGKLQRVLLPPARRRHPPRAAGDHRRHDDVAPDPRPRRSRRSSESRAVSGRVRG